MLISRGVIQIVLHRFFEYRRVRSEIITGGRVDVLVTSKVFDEADVRSVVTKVRTEGVTEDMGCDVFLDSGSSTEGAQIARDVAASPASRSCTVGYEQCFVVVLPQKNTVLCLEPLPVTMA
jgi:hypothetical protein